MTKKSAHDYGLCIVMMVHNVFFSSFSLFNIYVSMHKITYHIYDVILYYTYKEQNQEENATRTRMIYIKLKCTELKIPNYLW